MGGYAAPVFPALCIFLAGPLLTQSTLVEPAGERTDSMEEYRVHNIRQCQRLCWYRKPCSAFSFSSKPNIAHNCVVHADPLQVAFLPVGWTIYTASSPGVNSPCVHQKCTETEVCAPMSSSGKEFRCLALPVDRGKPPTTRTAKPSTVTTATTTITKPTTSTATMTTTAKPPSTATATMTTSEPTTTSATTTTTTKPTTTTDTTTTTTKPPSVTTTSTTSTTTPTTTTTATATTAAKPSTTTTAATTTTTKLPSTLTTNTTTSKPTTTTATTTTTAKPSTTTTATTTTTKPTTTTATTTTTTKSPSTTTTSTTSTTTPATTTTTTTTTTKPPTTTSMTTTTTTTSVKTTTTPQLVCKNGGTVTGNACTCPQYYTGRSCERLYRDCKEAYEVGRLNGAFYIQPVATASPFLVVCSNSYNHIMRRVPVQQNVQDFAWVTYRQELMKEVIQQPNPTNFFVGLEPLRALTSQADYRLVISLRKTEVLKTVTAGHAYDNFYLGPESSNYTLMYSRYRPMQTGFLPSNGFPPSGQGSFHTYDRDRNTCYTRNGGAGWYSSACYGYTLFLTSAVVWPALGSLQYWDLLDLNVERMGSFYVDSGR